MNEQFFELPEEKRLRIINAGFEVFGENEYKRASTDLIAARAGISKGLLFYYFHNKKSFYIYLYEYAGSITREYVIDTHFAEITDFFELCVYSAEKKFLLFEKMPYIYSFSLRAFYSKGDDVSDDMSDRIQKSIEGAFATYFTSVDFSKFKEDIKPQEILEMLTWMSDGYIYEHQRSGQLVSMEDLMEKFRGWITMLRKLSYKEEYQK